MNSFKKIAATIVLMFAIVLLVSPAIDPILVSAQGRTDGQLNYTPLAPLPGIGEQVGPPGPDGTVPAAPVDITTYAQGIFRLVIGLAAALAVIMITIGGVEYIGSDTISSKESGKDRIQQALLGLFLAMGAWLILYTVNPRLVSLDFLIEPLPTIITPEVEAQPIVNIYKIETCYTGGTGAEGRRYKHLATYTDRQYGSIQVAIRMCNAASPQSGIIIPRDTTRCTRIVYSCDRNAPEGYVETGGGNPTIPGYYVVVYYRRLNDNAIGTITFGPREQAICEARAAEGIASFTAPTGTEVTDVRCIHYAE